jgi:aryl-alcohol dehydrogenase-like predicted oxidoreductase
MDLTRTALGTWSGGRFMHFGEPLDEARHLALFRRAWERGVRTFVTADVYGAGAADELLGRALAGLPRDSYCLVGAIGHDFYQGKREGAKGYPRFTDPALRPPREYRDYVRRATEESLKRCRSDAFDLLLLHNPDRTGFTSDAVWEALRAVRDEGLAARLGVAPGPANGFTLDLLLCIERFAEVLDWAMIILNPFEPWPGQLVLPAAEKHDVKVLTRVVDYGGLFHDDVKPGHRFADYDHRTFRPAGWVEAGVEKLEKIRPHAARHGLTPLQLACVWNLAQPAVASVVPTLIQESGEGSKPIEAKLDELAALPETALGAAEVAEILAVGDNTGCMELKGGNPRHTGAPQPDRWALDADLLDVARRWGMDPADGLSSRHLAGRTSFADKGVDTPVTGN